MIEFIFIIIDYLNNIIVDHYLYSFCMYFIILTLFFTLSLPGGLFLLLGSGFFFGFIQGFIINIFSISLGSLLFIFLSKSILKSIFNKYYQKFSIMIARYMKNSSLEYLILIRMIVGIPLIVQNICISLLNISQFKILLSSFIGFAPIMLLLSYIGNYCSTLIQLKTLNFSEIYSYEIFIIFGIVIFLILIRIFYKKIN